MAADKDPEIDAFVGNTYKEVMSLLKPKVGNNTTYKNDLYRHGRELFGRKFRGVFARDEIPHMGNGQMCIANLDTSDQPGSHWIAIYGKKGKQYVYDSYGRSTKKILPDRSGAGYVPTEQDAEQSKSENNCGLRSMTALYLFDSFDPDVVAKYL